MTTTSKGTTPGALALDLFKGHTPGPWKIDHEDPTGVRIQGVSDGIIAAADYTGDRDITRANARLIAAAPDLLARAESAERVAAAAQAWHLATCDNDAQRNYFDPPCSHATCAIGRAEKALSEAVEKYASEVKP